MFTVAIIAFGALALAGGTFTASLSGRRGVAYAAWILYGALLLPVALPHAVLKRRAAGPTDSRAPSNLKRVCPACDERLPSAARACRYCGWTVDDGGGSRAQAEESYGLPWSDADFARIAHGRDELGDAESGGSTHHSPAGSSEGNAGGWWRGMRSGSASAVIFAIGAAAFAAMWVLGQGEPLEKRAAETAVLADSASPVPESPSEPGTVSPPAIPENDGSGRQQDAGADGGAGKATPPGPDSAFPKDGLRGRLPAPRSAAHVRDAASVAAAPAPPPVKAVPQPKAPAAVPGPRSDGTSPAAPGRMRSASAESDVAQDDEPTVARPIANDRARGQAPEKTSSASATARRSEPVAEDIANTPLPRKKPVRPAEQKSGKEDEEYVTAVGELVVWLQRRLAALGFYDGPLSGQADARTRSAIAAYQRSRSLTPSGRIDPALLISLRGGKGRDAREADGSRPTSSSRHGSAAGPGQLQ